MASVQWYADCISNGDDPAAVLRVALAEQRDIDARIAEKAYSGTKAAEYVERGLIAAAIRAQASMHAGSEEE